MHRISLLVLLLTLIVPTTTWAQAPTAAGSAQNQCRAAIGAVERESGIPTGLLHAIGRVESGRRDEATGQVGPWPWTVNAQGQGRYFPSKAEAIAHVRQLQAAGVRSIDVGCMQINQYYHADAFAGLEQAFDPMTNVRYAARFLKELQGRAGDWMRAAGHYHSQTPERAEAYRNAVAAALPAAQRDAASAPATVPAPAPAGSPTWSVATGAAMAGGGYARGGSSGVPGGGMGATVNRVGAFADAGRGRGLDAYRSMAIPLASRLSPTLAARGG